MQAIIVTGGKQYNVKEGDVIYIEKLAAEAEQTVTFDQVLAVVDGADSKFGTPTVAGAKVEAKVLKNGKGKKIRVFKYRPKKDSKSLSRATDSRIPRCRSKRSLCKMTRVEFFDQDGRISGFCCTGHSGYGEEGADIVCAAVSAAVKLTECTINDVLGEHAKTRVNEEEARVTLNLPAACENEEAVQAVLTGMMLTMCSLRDEYPDYIEVLEV